MFAEREKKIATDTSCIALWCAPTPSFSDIFIITVWYSCHAAILYTIANYIETTFLHLMPERYHILPNATKKGYKR